MYPNNEWYVAAYPWEIGSEPLARTLLDEPLVLYRTGSGRVAALSDRCIHRLMPLSKGWVVGERLQCGYHGALYDPDGRCAEVPGQDGVPEKARVRSFPLQERYGFVWVWMGDPSLAAVKEPCPLYAYLGEEEGWDTLDGYIYIAADYQLSNDNLADLTHTEFVHRSTLGTQVSRASRLDGKPVEQQGEHTFESTFHENGFDAVLRSTDCKIAPTMEAAYARKHGKERWGNLDFDLRFYFRAPGFWIFSPWVKRPDAGDEDWVWVSGILINTPETSKTTHFFHKMCQKYAPDDHDVTRHWHEQTTTAFLEDKAVLEDQQRSIGSADVHDYPVVSFDGDRLGFQARKMVREQIAAESATGHAN